MLPNLWQPIIRRGHAVSVGVHCTVESLRALRTGEMHLDFQRRIQLLISLTECPRCWQIARRKVDSEGWPATTDVVVLALRSASTPEPLEPSRQRALARPLAFFHLVLEELRDLASGPGQDEGTLRRTVMYLDLFLAGLELGEREDLPDARLHMHLVTAEFWASRGQWKRAKEELRDAEFSWRHGGRDPLLQAEIALLQSWIEKLESKSRESPERSPHVGLDR